MVVVIENCNNIRKAEINIAPSKLNIKYAANGTGKTTISQAIILSVGKGGMEELLPFDMRGKPDLQSAPRVTGVDGISTVKCFNESYVNQFVFMKDELVANSFDVIVKTPEYQQLVGEIDQLTADVKNCFEGRAELDSLFENLSKIAKAFTLTKTGLSKSSFGMKALSRGNVLEHIPAGLESYEKYIKGDSSVSWLEWHANGDAFLSVPDECPYCAVGVDGSHEKIKKVGESYDKKLVKNLKDILDTVQQLGDFFSDETRNSLYKITQLVSGLGKEHQDFLRNVKQQVDTLLGKLGALRGLSGYHFEEGEKVDDKLRSLRLDLEYLKAFDSETTRGCVDPINASIDALVARAGILQGKVSRQRKKMKETIRSREREINEFLSYAGYRYRVAVIGDGEESRLKLRHVDCAEHISGGSQHLSYGERNAFALVLFMYECLSVNPDLIVLDDPISSFDKNKKYAILEMLFGSSSGPNLVGRTVLMLTHDVEPIVDLVGVLHRRFSNKVEAAFLRLSSGIVRELSVRQSDVQTFARFCAEVVGSGKHVVLKLIYMRRHYEVSDGKGDAYEVLSNVLHGRRRAIDSRYGDVEMTSGDFVKGCDEIASRIGGFNYSGLVDQVVDSTLMRELYDGCVNGYEKLQVFRLLNVSVGNSVISKFLNETYHVENELVCQLDPTRFDVVPEYVVVECDRLIAEKFAAA